MSLTFKSVNEFEPTCVTIQIKAIQQYFHEYYMVFLEFGNPGSERVKTLLTGYNVVSSQEPFPSDRWIRVESDFYDISCVTIHSNSV